MRNCIQDHNPRDRFYAGKEKHSPYAVAYRCNSLTGAVLRKDLRCDPCSSDNAWARVFHAVAFTFVDKWDSGHRQIVLLRTFPASGGLAGKLYLPAGYNDVSHAEIRTAALFGGLGSENLLREFAR